MLNSILDLPLLMTIGSGVINFLLILVELGLYGITLLSIFFIIKGFIKIPKISAKIFILGELISTLAAIVSLSLGYFIGSINI